MANALENSASVDDCVGDEEEVLTVPSSSSLCCCLPGIGLGRLAKDGPARRHLLPQGGGGSGEEESWLVRGAKKAKEASELLAGPKWKNFLRSFTRKKRSQFHYDPDSYALNFDDNIDANNQGLEFSSH